MKSIPIRKQNDGGRNFREFYARLRGEFSACDVIRYDPFWLCCDAMILSIKVR